MVASDRAVSDTIGVLYGDHADAKMRQMMTDLEEEIRNPGDLEIVEEEEEIDLAALSKASADAPIIKLVNLRCSFNDQPDGRHGRRALPGVVVGATRGGAAVDSVGCARSAGRCPLRIRRRWSRSACRRRKR